MRAQGLQAPVSYREDFVLVILVRIMPDVSQHCAQGERSIECEIEITHDVTVLIPNLFGRLMLSTAEGYLSVDSCLP